MTTKDIITLLPIDEQTKTEVLRLYDYMDSYQKLSVDELCWASYFDLYNERFRENISLQFAAVKEGNGEFGDDLTKRALAKTEQEMKESLQEALRTVDLSEARLAMQKIIKEVNDAKTAKKAHT